jgi:hypothetical protein
LPVEGIAGNGRPDLAAFSAPQDYGLAHGYGEHGIIGYVLAHGTPISLSHTNRALQIWTSRQGFSGAISESCILSKYGGYVQVKFEGYEDMGRQQLEMVVALGKQAGEALGKLADLTMPHPHAVLKHGDKGEVLRKAAMLREAPSVQEIEYGCDRGLPGEEIRCPIFKNLCGEAIVLQCDCRARHRRLSERCDECRDHRRDGPQ